MSQENVEKSTAFLAAYNRRDFDAAVEFFDPEVEWVLPAHQRSDSCRGPDEIKRFWAGAAEPDPQSRCAGSRPLPRRNRAKKPPPSSLRSSSRRPARKSSSR